MVRCLKGFKDGQAVLRVVAAYSSLAPFSPLTRVHSCRKDLGHEPLGINIQCWDLEEATALGDLTCHCDPILGKAQLEEGRVDFCSEFEGLFEGTLSIMVGEAWRM